MKNMLTVEDFRLVRMALDQYLRVEKKDLELARAVGADCVDSIVSRIKAIEQLDERVLNAQVELLMK